MNYKFLLYSLCIAVILYVCACGKADLNEKKAPNMDELTEYISVCELSSANVGDVVCIGEYEQDSQLPGKEKIYWDVVDVDGDTIVLVSHFVIDLKQFNMKGDINPGWENSYIRAWLNSEFYNSAFTDQEKGLIVYSEVDNIFPAAFFDDIGEKYVVREHSSTQDYIYLLSLDEIIKYYDAEIWCEEDSNKKDTYYSSDMIAEYSPDCALIEYEKMLDICDKYGFDKNMDYPTYSNWLLRSDFTFDRMNMLVTNDGFVRAATPNEELGIRPAMRVKKGNEE